MLMYNLLEYNENYSMTSESLQNYYRNEVNDCANENAKDFGINNYKTTKIKSFGHKANIIGSTPNNNSILDTEVVVPLKYLRNFWRFLDLPLIYCEIKLRLR